MFDDAMTPRRPQRDTPARLLILLALPALLAFATGVLATLVFGSGPLADRAEQEVAELQAQLHQVRRSEAWLMTLAAQYIQATETCQAAANSDAITATQLEARAGAARAGGAQ